MNKSTYLICAAVFGGAIASFAQTTTPPLPRPPCGPYHRPPFPGPLVRALDTNHDGVISADEIAAASASLKRLDRNGDGIISADELRPPRPAGAPPPPAKRMRHHPLSPLLLALDANGDGELSPTEIANAPASLRALDLNHDGQLTPDELCPLPPEEAPPPRE